MSKKKLTPPSVDRSFIAVKTSLQDKKLKKINEELSLVNKNLTRSEEVKCAKITQALTDQVGKLSGELEFACNEINSVCMAKGHQQCIKLIASVNTAKTRIPELITICVDLNNDHNEKFGHPVYPDILKEIKSGTCFDMETK